MNLYSYCNIVGKTDVGCKRKVNEDWMDHFECRNGLVAVVCDGMGGHVGGEIASHLAVETIRKFLENNYYDNPRHAIMLAIEEANNAILERTRQQPELTGMGATCVLLIVRDGKVYYGSVGDSRIYLVRSKHITQLTVDQSYVQMLVDMGEITKEEAEHHPRKNEITNALGIDSMKPATVADDPIDPEAGDCFILCSDGLSGMMTDNDILRIASNQQKMSQQQRVDTLIDLARKNGGLDNITCEIVEFSMTPSQVVADNQTKKRNGLYVGIGVAVLLVAVALILLLTRKGDTAPAADGDDVELFSDKSVVTTYPDSLGYIPGVPLLEISTNPDYKSLEVNAYNGKEFFKKYIIGHDVSLDHLNFAPDSDIKTTIDGGKMSVTLHSVSEAHSMRLSFADGDSTYVYIFPIRLLSTDAGDIVVHPVAVHDPVVSNPQVKDPLDIINQTPAAQQPAADESGEMPKEVTVTLTKADFAFITLTSAKGTNTDTDLFTDCVIGKIDTNGGWYLAHCTDNHKCTITVDTKKVPAKGAVISIPLTRPQGEYKIHVKK